LSFAIKLITRTVRKLKNPSRPNYISIMSPGTPLDTRWPLKKPQAGGLAFLIVRKPIFV